MAEKQLSKRKNSEEPDNPGEERKTKMKRDVSSQLKTSKSPTTREKDEESPTRGKKLLKDTNS